MPYTVQQLARLAGVTTRTLHHYDEIGLLSPARNISNGYRQYGEEELLKLQQIMFFRELELPLPKIKEILEDPNFDTARALQEHRKLIEIKKKRMNGLIMTIDKTLKKIANEKSMSDQELYDGFTKEEAEAYAKEAKERWGNTEAYKQSQERYGKLSKEDKLRIQQENDQLLKEIVANMEKGPESPEVQALIDKHFNSLRVFYEPNLGMYRGLGSMYVDDKRFGAYFEKYHPNLPIFMRDAMHAYCDTKTS